MRINSTRLWWAGPALLCLAAAVIMTWPVLQYFSTRAAGSGGDTWQWVWYLDYVFRSVTAGVPLAHPTELFYPRGFDLWAGYEGTLALVLGVPIRLIVRNPIATYNALILIGLATSAFCAFILGRHLFRHWLPSTLAGFLFGFSPYLLARAQGHLGATFAGVIPLLALALLLWFERPTFRRAALAGGALGLCAMATFYYALVGGLLAAIMIIHRLLTDSAARSRVFVKQILVFSAGGLLISGLIAAPMIMAVVAGQAARPVSGGAVKNSADIVSFIIPAPFSNLQRWAASLSESTGYTITLQSNRTEAANYLGVLSMALAVVGAIFWPPRKMWILVGLISALLALGPRLVVFGRDTGMVLPYDLIPFSDLARVPSRFVILASLAVAILSAAAIRRVRWHGLLLVVGGAVLAGLVLERSVWPFPTSQPPYPSVMLDRLRAAPGRALAILPAGVSLAYATNFNYLPVATGKAITEGYIMHTSLTPDIRRFVDDGWSAPFACSRVLSQRSLPPAPEPNMLANQLRGIGIEQVLLIKYPTDLCGASFGRSLAAIQAWPVLFEDNKFRLVTVPRL